MGLQVLCWGKVRLSLFCFSALMALAPIRKSLKKAAERQGPRFGTCLYRGEHEAPLSLLLAGNSRVHAALDLNTFTHATEARKAIAPGLTLSRCNAHTSTTNVCQYLRRAGLTACFGYDALDWKCLLSPSTGQKALCHGLYLSQAALL